MLISTLPWLFQLYLFRKLNSSTRTKRGQNKSQTCLASQPYFSAYAHVREKEGTNTAEGDYSGVQIDKRLYCLLQQQLQ